ncbi:MULTISPECIES: hypothetical protein [unclassified Anaeromyxobacter]|uniref:hypothetical protein n=1 Tax=unclassified Anaeromyxobacter TaxID=2620896 RepID=UPI001F59E051|nr:MULTISPECIES: hypothetical protein [unclassified Anaeromyxobacter]
MSVPAGERSVLPGRRDLRTVVFRKSAVTGWWYGFGVVEAPQSARAETPPGKAGATR